MKSHESLSQCRLWRQRRSDCPLRRCWGSWLEQNDPLICLLVFWKKEIRRRVRALLKQLTISQKFSCILSTYPGKYGFHMRMSLSKPPVTNRLCCWQRSNVLTPLWMMKTLWSHGARGCGAQFSWTFLALPLLQASLISLNCCSASVRGSTQPWKKKRKNSNSLWGRGHQSKHAFLEQG